MATILLDYALPLTGILVLVYIFRSYRADRAAVQASSSLGSEKEDLQALLDRQAQLVAYLEACNYCLACELYGKERVDRQLREAASRGSN